ncbi:F-box protein CPR1 [Cicer arietinum]|uniref:F-box protein CPR1 n=1 Tax=Cicer arietinum TaxID=3827 RepID=A0A1S2XAD5_CICAR|nr:F-box protein CPR1 [Cicer arietinum]
MADIPPELLTDILSLLPVQSLLRFRSTSKPLRSLIDSNNFINLHLNKSTNFNLIVRHNSDLYQIDFPNLTSTTATAVQLNHPLMCYSNRITLLGSCNGLLCISNVADDIAFWNPSLRKHRIIPYLRISPRSKSDTSLFAARVHGFGFDPFAGDYKLVRISYFVDLQNRTFDSQVRLFSSRTNSWKVLPSMCYALCCARTMGVFVDNSLHWVVTRKLEPGQPDLIVAFNLTLEIFNEVPLPEIEVVDNNGESFEIDVAVLGGCLCMIVNYEITKVDVWVMKEYVSRDSWFKLLTLVGSCYFLPLKSLRPLGYSNDGSKVLLEVDRKKLFWYDFKSEQVSFVSGISNMNEAMICVGSLVPPSLPIVDNYKKENQHKLRCESISKRRDDFLSQGFKLTL